MTDQPHYTEGVLGDAAAILRDGVMMPIEEIVSELNRLTALAHPEPAGEVADDQIEAEFRGWFKDTYGDRYYGAIPLVVLISWTRHKLALDRSRRTPVQPAEGEVAKLVGAIEAEAREERDSGHLHWLTAGELTRIVALLEHHQPPQPVAVGERLPGPENRDEEGKCWWFCFECPGEHSYWILAKEVYCNPTYWLPYNALPTPHPPQEVSSSAV